MYFLIIKQFIRSKTAVLAFVILFLMGMISILIGKQFLSKQENTIAEITRQQQEHIERNVTYHKDNLGLLLYYVRFALVNETDNLAALSVGQRDVNPSVRSVTIRNLEGQKYDTDLNNPSNLQSGNLDLGFVIIYLFPLFIIATTFNLLSEESETGTWRLIAIQSKSKLRYLLVKLSIRALLLYSVLIMLFLAATVTLSLHLNEKLFAFIALSIVYLTFWFALCFWIVSFQRSSSFNVLTLLSLWVALALLLPASVNNFVTNRYPVPEALETMIKQRDGYHEKWDLPREATMNKFFAHYPQFEKYASSAPGFNWLWYYAMQQMGDDESAEYSRSMREKIMQREQTSRLISLAIPTMHTQLLFNDVARTSLSNHMRFLDKTDEFHERTRLYFYPKIFQNEPVENENWDEFKPEYISERSDFNWLNGLSPLALITLIILFLTILNTRRI
ncbi:MAG: DUF3526 domain-containing protein [Cyclobacteriaceae bacterium]